jgi:hypothetical protein
VIELNLVAVLIEIFLQEDPLVCTDPARPPSGEMAMDNYTHSARTDVREPMLILVMGFVQNLGPWRRRLRGRVGVVGAKNRWVGIRKSLSEGP